MALIGVRPFAKWQGSLSHLHANEFGAHVAKDELAKRNIDPARFDYAVLGHDRATI